MVGRKGVKSEELKLQCEWAECRRIYLDLGEFYQHLASHYHDDFGPEQIAEAELGCKWTECTFFTNCRDDILRHMYFHGYHTKVKWWGLLCHQQLRLGECRALHSRNVIPELPDGFKCEWKDCGMLCDVPDQFYMHVNDHAHFAEKEALTESTKGLRCHWEGCTYTYEMETSFRQSSGRFKLRDHLRTHTKERSYACPWCGNLYVNKTKFADHLDRQTSVESHCFQCTHCSRTFSTERLLKDHMRHHVNHYKCPKCAMTCPNPSALRHHIRYKHTDERPFACQYCPYKSKAAYDLQVHMAFHRGDLSYKCHVVGCDYAVRSLQSLRYHFRTKHLIGRGKCYVCHLCDKKYGVGFQLTNHLRKAHNFHWPPGHSRFKYKESEDGFFRLQTFRFESVELTEQLMVGDQSTQQGSGSATDATGQQVVPLTQKKKTTRKRKRGASSSNKRVTRSTSARMRANESQQTPQPEASIILDFTIPAEEGDDAPSGNRLELIAAPEGAVDDPQSTMEIVPLLPKHSRRRSRALSPVRDYHRFVGDVAGGSNAVASVVAADHAPSKTGDGARSKSDLITVLVDYTRPSKSTSDAAVGSSAQNCIESSESRRPQSSRNDHGVIEERNECGEKSILGDAGMAENSQKSPTKSPSSKAGTSSDAPKLPADTCQLSMVDGRLATDEKGNRVSVKVDGKNYFLVRGKDVDGKDRAYCLVAAENYLGEQDEQRG